MHLSKKNINLLLGLLALISVVNAHDLEFKHLTPRHGLPDATINAIAQDSSGLMWFGTFNGLISYDGFRYRTYLPEVDNPSSITSRQVTSLFIDSRDQLWVSTFFGICRYDRINDRFDRITLANYQADRVFNTVFLEIDGIIILKTPAGYYYYPLDGDEEVLEMNQLVHEDSTSDRFNNLTVASANGNGFLLLEHPGAGTSIIHRAKIIQTGDTCTFHCTDQIGINHEVNCLLSLTPDHLYIGTPEGIYHMQTGSANRNWSLLCTEPGVSRLFLSSDQTLWFTSSLEGVSRYNLFTKEYERITSKGNNPLGLLHNLIISFHEDFSGNIWLGHRSIGISILNMHKENFNSFNHMAGNPNSLSQGSVLCFNHSGEDYFVGTDYSGLNLMRKNARTSEYVFESVEFPEGFEFHVPYQAIWWITRETDQLLWIGTNFGLIKAEKHSDQWIYTQFDTYTQTNIIQNIFIDEVGNMWIGAYNGLFLWPASHRDEFQLISICDESGSSKGLPRDVVPDILLDSKGNFWVGTQNNGLKLLTGSYYDLNLSGNNIPVMQFTTFAASSKKSGSLINNEINCIYEYYDGTIWCGTQGGGINILDPETGFFTYLTTEDGMPGDDVFGILADDRGNLWISTNSGLSMMNRYQDDEFISFTHSDGIQGNIFLVNSYYKADDGQLFFGGKEGFTFFNPEDIVQNVIPPKIRFMDLLLFGTEVPIGETIGGRIILQSSLNESRSITLSHKDYNFSIGLSSLHFDEPGDNKIAYKLEGYNQDWIIIPASEKYVHFTNLTHGSYLFRAKAINSDNIWSTSEKSLVINITPPWWRAWYGITGFAVLILMAIAGIVYLILQRALLQHKLQLEKMENENIQRVNESKLKFFTDISHELKTPLSLVIAPLEDLALRLEKNNDKLFTEQSGLILRNAKLLKRLIDQIIDFRKVNAGKLPLKPLELDICQFLRDIMQHFEVYKTSKNNRLIYYIPDESLYIWYDEEKIEKVVYNLLSNAFKHASEDGLILVSLEKVRKTMEYSQTPVEGISITVFNEGEEIPPDKMENIFERFYQIDNLAAGSGIGLALSKSLIDLHNGSIEVSSEEGNGVTFSVFLPSTVNKPEGLETEITRRTTIDLKQDLELDYSLSVENLEAADEEKDLKILLIEDNKELRDFLRTILERQYEYHEAPDGDAGLKIAEEIIPDLIISDVIMPHRDGYEVCQAIKDNVKTCHIPVVLLTAKSSPEHMIDGFDSGADAYVAKPFEIKVLLTQIYRLIKNRELIRSKYREQNFMVDIPVNASSKDDNFLKTVNDEIENRVVEDPDFNVSKLCETMMLSRTQIYRKIKALTGLSTVEYIRVVKLNIAVNLLKSNKYSVKEVCYMSGFSDPSYFIRCFKDHFKTTPSEFKYT